MEDLITIPEEDPTDFLNKAIHLAESLLIYFNFNLGMLFRTSSFMPLGPTKFIFDIGIFRLAPALNGKR